MTMKYKIITAFVFVAGLPRSSYLSWELIQVVYAFQVPAVYEEMILSGCTPDRKARAMLRSALRYMKQTLKT